MMTTIPLMRFNKANSAKLVKPVEIIRHVPLEKPKSTIQQLMEENENEDDYTVVFNRTNHGTY